MSSLTGPLRFGLVFLLLTSGCARLMPPPPVAPPPGSPPQAGTEAAAPVVAQPSPPVPAPTMSPPTVAPPPPTAPPPTAPPPAVPPPAVAAPAATPAVEPATAAPATAAATGATAGKAAPPAPKAPAKATAPPAPATPPSGKAATPPEGAKPKAPPLDLATLEQRLKATKAIGVLTKITLKNQIDDLLDQFRAYHQGKLRTSLADLRRSYDLLFLKVLSLLQDSDQALATAILASREAIWGILSDRAKFATI